VGRITFCALGLALLVTSAILAQRGYFRQLDEDEVAMPADATEKTEYVFARLRYPSGGGRFGGYRRGRGSWATDFPKADRQFLQGVRRLSRIHTRSMEQVVDLNSDDIYNYPWIYAVEVGHWGLSDRDALKLRDYLNRGGFLMVDDFHGGMEWEVFMDSLRMVYPDIAVTDLEDADPVFHVIWDMQERLQVPGIHTIGSGRTYERYDGVEAKWRAIYDEKQRRVTVAICHNMDLGDAWEWADAPEYPEKFASVAYRVAINYIVYSMTH
jgi:hypothetical protein